MHLWALGAVWLRNARPTLTPTTTVLMHLLALGAFWQLSKLNRKFYSVCRLNAPFGARCFLATMCFRLSCSRLYVLMHLLVLGAFWLARELQGKLL